MLRFVVLLFMAGLLSAGCQTKKASVSGRVSEAEHQAALQALESGDFYIEIYEFYYHQPRSRKNVASTHGSYLDVKDGKGRLYVSPATFRKMSFSRTLTPYTVQLTGKKERKKGDVVFDLWGMDEDFKSGAKEYWTLTLYAGSNECYFHGNIGTDGFRGRVYPGKDRRPE